MATEVLLPQWGMEMAEGTIVKWLKKEGEPIQEGEPLVAIETAKLETELESIASGVVAHILVAEGTTVPIRTVLAVIGAPGEEVPSPTASTSPTPTHVSGTRSSLPLPEEGSVPRFQPPATAPGQEQLDDLVVPAALRLARSQSQVVPPASPPAVSPIQVVPPVSPPAVSPVQAFPPASPPAMAPVQVVQPARRPARSHVQVVPAARRLAQQHGIDLDELKGTGPRGRILIEDVEWAIQEPPRVEPQAVEPAVQEPPGVEPQAVEPANPATPQFEGQAVPLTGIRRTIATRMLQSLQTMAQVTLTTEADVTQAMALRAGVSLHWQSAAGGSLSPLHLVIKSVARALKDHPRLNAIQQEDEVRLMDQVNIGVAVSLAEGLITPVLRNADTKSLAEIAEEARELADKTREGKARPEEVTGGTFTITNLGTYDIDGFTPIINPPQVGIIGVGRVVSKPIIQQGEITKGDMMFLSLTFDHRVVDGAPAAQFLQTVKNYLEQPWWMVA